MLYYGRLSLLGLLCLLMSTKIFGSEEGGGGHSESGGGHSDSGGGGGEGGNGHGGGEGGSEGHGGEGGEGGHGGGDHGSEGHGGGEGEGGHGGGEHGHGEHGGDSGPPHSTDTWTSPQRTIHISETAVYEDLMLKVVGNPKLLDPTIGEGLLHSIFGVRFMSVLLEPRLLSPKIEPNLLGMEFHPTLLNVEALPWLLSPELRLQLLGLRFDPRLLSIKLWPKLLSPEINAQLAYIDLRAGRGLESVLEPRVLSPELDLQLMNVRPEARLLFQELKPSVLSPTLRINLLDVRPSAELLTQEVEGGPLSPVVELSLNKGVHIEADDNLLHEVIHTTLTTHDIKKRRRKRSSHQNRPLYSRGNPTSRFDGVHRMHINSRNLHPWARYRQNFSPKFRRPPSEAAKIRTGIHSEALQKIHSKPSFVQSIPTYQPESGTEKPQHAAENLVPKERRTTKRRLPKPRIPHSPSRNPFILSKLKRMMVRQKIKREEQTIEQIQKLPVKGSLNLDSKDLIFLLTKFPDEESERKNDVSNVSQYIVRYRLQPKLVIRKNIKPQPPPSLAKILGYQQKRRPIRRRTSYRLKDRLQL